MSAMYASDPVKQPFRLRMEHPDQLRYVFPDNYLMQVTEQVMSLGIEPGSRIAKVWCLIEPEDE